MEKMEKRRRGNVRYVACRTCTDELQCSSIRKTDGRFCRSLWGGINPGPEVGPSGHSNIMSNCCDSLVRIPTDLKFHHAHTHQKTMKQLAVNTKRVITQHAW
jgi:hypothetical protein